MSPFIRLAISLLSFRCLICSAVATPMTSPEKPATATILPLVVVAPSSDDVMVNPVLPQEQKPHLRTPNSQESTLLSASTQQQQQYSRQRNLQGGEQIDNVREMLQQLFNTAPEAWTTGQWVLAAVLLCLALWCCGCCSGGRRYYRRGYYNQAGYYGGYRSTRGDCCGCLQNLLMCFCCYELCCADCQDVPCCNPNGLDAAYMGGGMV